MKFALVFVTSLLIFLGSSSRLAAQDPNFHIYLCFGQSNMEGQGAVEVQDKTVDARFRVFQSLNCSNLSRTKDQWYTATPPLCNCFSGLSPADYFGRTMIEHLPDSVTVGVINVAVGGCDIRLFDKDIYQDHDSTYTESWFLDKLEAYGWNPYQHLLDMALQAQQDGVIKGILLHQGETNTGQAAWPTYVNKIYNDLLADLSLGADETPLLAGEVFQGSGNCCSSMNTIINKLPNTVATAHVISSEDCGGVDNAHFDSEGYRTLGKRYATKMLNLQGIEVTGTKETLENEGYRLFQNYPNPSTGLTNISFEIPENTDLTLKVLDSTGQPVLEKVFLGLTPGKHQAELDLSKLETGLYLYSISTKEGSLSRRLVVCEK